MGAAVTAGQQAAGPVFGDALISSVPMDFNYLVALAAHYQQPGTFASGDLNGDGTVDFKDLVILAANYGHAIGASPAVQVPTRRRGDAGAAGNYQPATSNSRGDAGRMTW